MGTGTKRKAGFTRKSKQKFKGMPDFDQKLAETVLLLANNRFVTLTVNIIFAGGFIFLFRVLLFREENLWPDLLAKHSNQNWRLLL